MMPGICTIYVWHFVFLLDLSGPILEYKGSIKDVQKGYLIKVTKVDVIL